MSLSIEEIDKYLRLTSKIDRKWGLSSLVTPVFVINPKAESFSSDSSYFLRAPITIIRDYLGSLGNHTETERWTYTVPNGKLALVQSSLAQLSGLGGAENLWTDILVNSYPINEVHGLEDTPNCRFRFVPHNVLLIAGDVIIMRTCNMTANARTFRGTAHIVEFDG